ncbi:MAG TPA: hypothetical protein VNU46_03010 [Gemmatimonadaceae bacterium]|jgi:hypothetical protein|nr:hypothetical protein [Gemmatimonadaceae bacterium]
MPGDSSPFYCIYLGWITRPPESTALPPDAPEIAALVQAVHERLMDLWTSVTTDFDRAVYQRVVFDAWLAFATGRLKLPYEALDLSPAAPYDLARCVIDVVIRTATELHEGKTLATPDLDLKNLAEAEAVGATPWGMASLFPLQRPFTVRRFPKTLDGKPPDADAIAAESKRLASMLLDGIGDQLQGGMPNGAVEAALLYHWLLLASVSAGTPVILMLRLGYHMMLIGEQCARAVARVCMEQDLMTQPFVQGVAYVQTLMSHVPASELMAAERTAPPQLSGAMEHVLALDASEDAELSAFVYYRIHKGIEAGTFSPYDLMGAARVARDAGDLRPETVLMLADDLSLYLYINDSSGWTPAIVRNPDLLPGEDNAEFNERFIVHLDALGEPRLAEWGRTDWDACYNRLGEAKRETLRLWGHDYHQFDATLHMLPLAAAAIARAILAEPGRVAVEHRALLGYAEDVLALGDARERTRISRYDERGMLMALVQDGWRYAEYWEPETHARAALGIPPRDGPNLLGNISEMQCWLAKTPTLFEAGLVCLGMATLLVADSDPETELAPLLRRRWIKSIRNMTSDWLRERGYVRIHDVLMAVLEGPAPLVLLS